MIPLKHGARFFSRYKLHDCGGILTTPDTQRTKSDPIIVEQPGMRMTVAHRQGVGGSDEGLTFDITTAGPEKEGKRILRFDCFYENLIITSVPPENIRFIT